jgi:hypothetical protein
MKLIPLKIMPNRASLVLVSGLVCVLARAASISSGIVRRTLTEGALYLALMLLLHWGCTVKNPAYREEMAPLDPDGAVMDGADPELEAVPPMLDVAPSSPGRGDGLPLRRPGGRDLVLRGPRADGCLNDACVGCVLESYYHDGDNDGYGDPAQVVEACEQQPPVDRVTEGGDCDDSDPLVYPAQTDFFVLPANWLLGYDYNCDGKEELEVPDLNSCTIAGETCAGDGWELYVPSCGVAGWHVSCVFDGWSGCWPVYSYRLQRCR